MENWTAPSELFTFDQLSQQLADVYEEFPQLGALYPHRFYDDPTWVTQRWLELLPLDSVLFEKLAGADDCLPALNFLRHALATPPSKQAGI